LVGQFDGLPELSTLEDLRARLQLSESKQIIDLSKNPLSNSNLFAQLFSAISHKQVIKIQYYRFDNINNHHDTIVHPYLLKEYNRRWYLICASEKDDKLLTFALDRIISIETLPAHTYKEYDGNLQERYEDIVGVTLYDNKPLEHIVFWVSDESKHYVMTKPIHESQRNYTQERATELRKTYPMLINGAFFSVDCIVNYELIRELMSFGKDLLVLEPETIKNEVIVKISTNLEEYNKLRT
jgi:predicted DNA-binding transcriptional regulator YafY